MTGLWNDERRITAKSELRFFPVREAKSRAGYKAGPTRTFASLGELDHFMTTLSLEAGQIAWITWPDGEEKPYIEPDERPQPSMTKSDTCRENAGNGAELAAAAAGNERMEAAWLALAEEQD
jgi:hypothetical protein